MSRTRRIRSATDLAWELYGRMVARISGDPRRAALLLGAALLAPLILTVQFFGSVQAGLQELLPKEAASVRALERLHTRLGGKANLTVIAQSPDAASNRRFMRRLSAALEERALPEARSVQGDCATERLWLRDHAPLLVPANKFGPLVDELEDALAHAEAAANPFYIDLDSSPGSSRWRRLEERIEAETRSNDRFPSGFFETSDGKMVVGLIWLEGSEVELEPSQNLFRAVERQVAELKAEFRPDLRVSYSGEVKNLLEEHAAILADLSLSSAVVTLLVGLLITLYFRSLRAVATVIATLLPGLIATFAIGKLTVGHLNSNTAFLGSIIAGNGINFPLVFLAYFRTRSPLEARPHAIVAAARQAFPGTLAAAATASAAYGGLAVSTFKGFSQFGWLGGIGMVTTWALTYLAMPIAISLIDPPRHGERPTRAQSHLLAFFARRRAPRWVAAGFALTSLATAIIGTRYAAEHGLYEMDLRALRNRDSLRSGSASWDAKIGEMFGVWLNPVAVLVDDPSHREPAAAELRRVLTEPTGTGEPAVAERVETIDLYLPSAAEQAGRLRRLERLRDKVSKLPRDDLPAKLRPLVDAWLDPGRLRAITDRDVPPRLRQAFAEVSGRADRVVLVYPSLKIDYNDGRNILRFADRVASARLPADATVGGGFLFMGEIIRLVHDEAPRVVLVVCLLVALVLVPIFFGRPLRVPLIVATVVAVAVASQAVMFALGVQLNMLNFAAVPITIGVGSDYLVNLLGAMDAFKVDARRACARMGGAILLCSLTTVVGYISLVMAQSGALRTFGWAAVLGELMAVTTVLVVLPVLLPTKPTPAVELSAAAPPSAEPPRETAAISSVEP